MYMYTCTLIHVSIMKFVKVTLKHWRLVANDSSGVLIYKRYASEEQPAACCLNQVCGAEAFEVAAPILILDQDLRYVVPV